MGEPAVTYGEAQALYRAAYGMARRLGQDDPTAADLAQEAIVRAISDWPRVCDHAAPWVSRVVANLVVDDWRRRNRTARLMRRGDGQNTPREEAVDLVRALARLPRRQREAVVYRYVMDLSQEDTAQAMGCSIGSVRQHTTRGLGTLRTVLGPDYQISTGGLSDV